MADPASDIENPSGAADGHPRDRLCSIVHPDEISHRSGISNTNGTGPRNLTENGADHAVFSHSRTVQIAESRDDAGGRLEDSTFSTMLDSSVHINREHLVCWPPRSALAIAVQHS